MTRALISAIALVLLLTGCGTKKQYFEPEQTAGAVSFDGSIPSEIVEVTRYGATLKNGQIITSKGVSSVTMPEGFNFLGEFDHRLIAVADCGDLKVLNETGTVLFEKKFPRAIASASISGDLLAVVSSGNRLSMLNMQSGEVVFDKKQDDVYALDSRMAAPYFLSGLVLFPTLDGKVVIIDKKSGQIIRDVVISSERYFNNVIFLDVLGDRLVAATAKRVISINPKTTVFLDADVKDVILLENRVFVFTKDGRILLTDADLKVLKERKFLFATFSGAIHGEFVYVVEKNGYMIATDLDLITTNIYELPSDIDAKMFTTNDTIYYDDRYFKLNAAK